MHCSGELHVYGVRTPIMEAIIFIMHGPHLSDGQGVPITLQVRTQLMRSACMDACMHTAHLAPFLAPLTTGHVEELGASGVPDPAAFPPLCNDILRILCVNMPSEHDLGEKTWSAPIPDCVCEKLGLPTPAYH